MRRVSVRSRFGRARCVALVLAVLGGAPRALAQAAPSSARGPSEPPAGVVAASAASTGGPERAAARPEAERVAARPEAERAAARPEPVLPSPWPEVAAVLPGFLVHGSGLFLQRRPAAARRLLLLEGAGVVGTLTSGVILVLTGAARDVVGPTALLAVAGVSTFGVSFLANVYATWAPPDGFGAPLDRLPALEASLGYLHVHDPQFPSRSFAAAGASGRLQAWRLSGSAAQALSGESRRLELGAGYRLLGPRGAGAPAAADGSYLEPRVALIDHAFPEEGFSSLVAELALEGRLDVERYLPDVRGAFFQGEAGWARQVFRHHLPGPNPSTTTSLLLAHVGFGIYLGNRQADATGGEVELYYDHRHDGFAGGLKVTGLGSGVAGHFGLRGQYQLTPRWGLRARAEAGSAYTLGLDLVVRVGAEPVRGERGAERAAGHAPAEER